MVNVIGVYLSVIGLVCLLAMSVAIIADAFSRTTFNMPIYGLNDLLEIITPVIVASCLPVALANKQNISIRFLGKALPVRPGQLIELFGQITALLVMLGIAFEVGRYTLSLFHYSQSTWLLRLPIWPSWVLATVLLAFCIPIQTAVVLDVIRDYRAKRAFKDPEAELLGQVEGKS
ncbi:TRAP transporter small permease [uncultured Sneathiella sp.]|uniref:TRAP transporter small permease n=1 Tax=uncultured Sneathiella sp. TaxID=879315 RepID=UPI0030EB9768|tara:strand:- start:40589 stop:41113 length:525 start_codon:yes stop_codon:yes gene_type:complete